MNNKYHMTLMDFVDSDYFHACEEEFWTTDIYIDYRNERIDQIFEARKKCLDGRTNLEIINFEKDIVEQAYKDGEITEKNRNNLLSELNAIEFMHCKNNSLHMEV